MDNILRTDYTEVMQKSYIDYAMSVIVARALPDVRDGLKPVQRRTLYDMMQLGVKYDKPFRKSARIVGDTMGRFHPHGDSSIYESLVVMSQEYKKGMPLVEGHGNFGSIEGDGAAAMRYTEARLQKITQEAFLADLDKDVVDFVPNFDQNEEEPEVLPVRIPNLLINGADGIAVGMATSIPPHNLAEVIDAAKLYLKNPNVTVEQLLEVMQGPDFPTGGIIVNKDDLKAIYETGSGKIRVRGKVTHEKLKGGKEALVITEIPYPMVGAGIGKFLNDVVSLIENKTAMEISDISNQSGKDGIRIVLELKKNADANKIENMLYKKTKLEDTFGVNMLTVADGKPEVLGLKAFFEHFTKFQYSITKRKYTTLLQQAKKKKEIQEGLMKAYDVIDLIIEILRGSKNLKQAKACLVDGITEGIQFKKKTSEKQAMSLNFTEAQATAILEMRLYRLIGLEIEALEKEYEKTMKEIERYEDILTNEKTMRSVIMKELDGFKKEFGTPRKTVIENREEVVYEEKIQEIPLVVLMDRLGYIRTVDVSAYERNKEAAENENKYIISCMNTDRLCVFTDTGMLHSIKIMDLPYGKFRDKGVPIDNLCHYNSVEERILYVNATKNLEQQKLLFTTAQGMVKIVAGSEFQVSKKAVVSTKLAEGDQVVSVEEVKEECPQLILQTKKGVFLRFLVEEVPEKKKMAIGVRGIKLAEGDEVEQAILVVGQGQEEFFYKEKRLQVSRVKLNKRDTKGTKLRLS